MTAQPTWSPVDEQTGSLLDLLADDGSAIPGPDEEWREFVYWLLFASNPSAIDRGRINPNVLRRLIRGAIKPQRIGAFTRRAVLEGIVEYTGNWVVSDDSEGKNAGKPCRELRWIS